MGVTWSSVTDCLGSISDPSPPPGRYSRVPAHHRVAPSSSPPPPRSSTSTSVLRQRSLTPAPNVTANTAVLEDKLKQCAIASQGAAIAPPPPPLVPDSNAVYNLLEDEQEDVCPTCLECYEDDNPKIETSCGHAFHLQCIVAWETRSGTRFCPICAKVMEYGEAEPG
eukprot:GFKZ01007771.1.p1 GENE.GFKZ01007771.1~~GFKZ01007771.1.p1  ORF type:complete len:167 (-),score=15.28 GFKZ01007771.1:809-1309(-)